MPKEVCTKCGSTDIGYESVDLTGFCIEEDYNKELTYCKSCNEILQISRLT